MYTTTMCICMTHQQWSILGYLYADADLVKAVGVQNFMRFHDRFFGRMFLSTKSESDISNNYGILMATCAPA